MAAEIMQWNVRETREPAEVGSFVMDGWELKKLLGKGGSGSVWLAEKNLMGIKSQSAVKIISIPHEPGDVNIMRNEGFSKEQIRAELLEQVQVTIREVQAMLNLRNHPAMVFCENYDIVQYEDDETWDVFIRMELLKPLTEWVAEKKVQEEDVRKIGITLADLLVKCEEKKLLHRDIKPSNIFIDEDGNYKLGDFGLARTQFESKSVHSKGVGTEAFMAPEVFSGERYDHRADIYSLGLVLYWLLNNQQLPFAGSDVSRTRAITKRLAGEKLPEITGINPQLAKTVQKACAVKPEDRYHSAKDFLLALQGHSDPEQTIIDLPLIITVLLFICLLIGVLFASGIVSPKKNQPVNTLDAPISTSTPTPTSTPANTEAVEITSSTIPDPAFRAFMPVTLLLLFTDKYTPESSDFKKES